MPWISVVTNEGAELFIPNSNYPEKRDQRNSNPSFFNNAPWKSLLFWEQRGSLFFILRTTKQQLREWLTIRKRNMPSLDVEWMLQNVEKIFVWWSCWMTLKIPFGCRRWKAVTWHSRVTFDYQKLLWLSGINFLCMSGSRNLIIARCYASHETLPGLQQVLKEHECRNESL